MKQVIESIATRLVLGCMAPLGVLTLVPNIMMGASGNLRPTIAGNLGSVSSCSFILGGLCGAFHNKYIPIKYSLILGATGVTTQLLSFVVMPKRNRLE